MKKRLPQKELKIYEEKLLNLKDDVEAQIRDISKDTLMKTQKDLSGDISGYSVHMADVATDNYEREFNLGLVSGERELLLEINEALKRIKDKDYGFCLKCKKPLKKRRLKAIPYAKFCIKCQSEEENSRNI